VSAIAYMHKRGYSHRDLKLDNILYNNNTQTVKLIDFGFSIKASEETKSGKLTIFCGTPHYMDPDLVKKQPYLGPAADVWAAGVILYIIMVGKLPFFGEFEADLFRKIQGGKFRPMPSEVGDQKVRNLFKRIFDVDAKTRITAEQILTENSWLNK
jgi:maternal embryonic leucine zipper kinase